MTPAPISDVTESMQAALCMLAGGPLVWHRAGWLDIVGAYHKFGTVSALESRGLVETYDRAGHYRVRLTSPRGRWFACTILGLAADRLANGQWRRDNLLARKLYDEEPANA